MSMKHAQKTKHVPKFEIVDEAGTEEKKASSREQEVKYEMIKISGISAPSLPARTELDVKGIEELAESIRNIGLIEPLIVKREKEGYEVIAGHRRLLACRLVKMEAVPCLIVAEDEAREDAIKLHENKFRTDLSDIEEAGYFAYLIGNRKISQSAIAKMMNVSESYVSQHLSILDWVPELRDAVAKKQISFTSARELARVKDVEVLRGYILHAVHNGVTPAVAMSWVQQWQSYQNAIPVQEKGEIGTGTRGMADVPMFACHFCNQPFPFDETLMVRTCPACLETIDSAMKQEGR